MTFDRPLAIAALLIVTFVYALAAYATWPTLVFSVDSWSLVELARSFERHAPFEFNTYRSYATDRYSASFPLGYPFLLFLARRMLGTADSVGVLINVAAAAATLACMVRASRKASGSGTPGLVAGVALLTYTPYMDEVFAARTIPVTLFALICAVLAASRYINTANAWNAAMAGAFAGLAMLLRFDAVVFAILLGVALALRTRIARTTAVYFLAAAVVASPWIVFSWTHFGRLWFSDNAWVATSAVRAYVLDYPAHASLTLGSDPGAWLRKFFANCLPFVASLGAGLIRCPAVLVLFSGWAWLRWRHHRAEAPSGEVPGKDAPREDAPVGFYQAALAISFLALLPQLTLGYFETRYWSLLWCLTCFVLALSLSRTSALASRKAVTAVGRSAAALAAVLALALAASAAPAMRTDAILVSQRTSVLKGIRLEDAMLFALHSCHLAEPRTFYVMSSLRRAARYGARYGDRVAFLPNNWDALSADTRADFVSRLGSVRFVDEAAAQRVSEAGQCSSLQTKEG